MEKKIIEGKLVNIKAIAISIFLVIGGGLDIVFFCVMYEMRSKPWYIKNYGANTVFRTISDSAEGLFLITLGAAIISLFFYYIFYKTELVVTDKRVYGKTSFGKRVDLPLDSISAVGTAILKSIAVTTSSGAIKFVFVANREEVHDKISELLVERQPKKPVVELDSNKSTQSSADELKKYKELFDSGIITQDEFEAKKKQLLEL